MKDEKIKKVLVIGSGPIVIGQAAEFDYAGTQACRILKREGIETVLVNSNPATIMTDRTMADQIYLEPLTLTTVERIIEKEKPDSIMAGLGGQTGLTLAMELDRTGFLKNHGVRLLGTSAGNITRAEDRRLFKEAMAAIGVPTIASETAETVDAALTAADGLGYPVIIRPGFTLGGTGGGVAYSPQEMRAAARIGLDASPIGQILVEKYIAGWEEIEFEMVRDHAGNTLCVCSMENIDPVGVHTGDSVVVAPAQTLDKEQLDLLRQVSGRIATQLQIEGGCNCQFALHPQTGEYYVIEVNPRVSRSSALASKATGYPIAKVTAMLALGYTLPEIKFDEKADGTAFTEPDVAFVALKFPRWPFDKFPGADRTLGTRMKSTGEVMAIGSTVEEALMKAVRGAEIGLDTLNRRPSDGRSLEERLADVTDLRFFTIFEALKAGVSVEHISSVTEINPFFIGKLKNLAEFEDSFAGGISKDQYLQGKKNGYTDAALRRLSGCRQLPLHLSAAYRAVDCCKGAFGRSSYYYSSYEEDAASLAQSGRKRILVLGSGPIRIGQGIEFDYSCVKCVETMRALGCEVVIINNNPETVSTDCDIADRLYFEPVTYEDVMNVIAHEKPMGVVVAFGGQTAVKLAADLDRAGVRLLGTDAKGIDTAEDREKFDAFLERLGLSRPRAFSAESMDEALAAAKKLGYPVLLRPSYVIGGQGMSIAGSDLDIRNFMEPILAGGICGPVLVDQYLPGRELEVDCISDGETVVIPGIMEHVERAGIHSGDSIAIYPAAGFSPAEQKDICSASIKIARGLAAKGLVNIQYLFFDGKLHVIDVNPRASRTVPYISKVTGVPMVELACRVMLGESLKDMGYNEGLVPDAPCCAVKVPVFSFEKLPGADCLLGPEMKSTGEVLGIGRSRTEALFKGLTAAGVGAHCFCSDEAAEAFAKASAAGYTEENTCLVNINA